MPHCVFHVSEKLYDDVNWTTLLPAFNQILCQQDSGFKTAATKGRAIRLNSSCIGTTDAPVNREYVHIDIAILAGRSPELRASITNTLADWTFEYLKTTTRFPTEVSINITELDPTIYAKRVPE